MREGGLQIFRHVRRQPRQERQYKNERKRNIGSGQATQCVHDESTREKRNMGEALEIRAGVVSVKGNPE